MPLINTTKHTFYHLIDFPLTGVENLLGSTDLGGFLSRIETFREDRIRREGNTITNLAPAPIEVEPEANDNTFRTAQGRVQKMRNNLRGNFLVILILIQKPL